MRFLLSIFLLLPITATAVQYGVYKDCAPVYTSSAAPEIAFSPKGAATELVVHAIESAHATVRVAAYSFTSQPIAQALLEDHKRGIDVRVVVDKSNATARYTAATFLANQDVPVRVDYRYAIMHDKFIVVDGETVEEGSFNYTAAAESKNAENLLVLHDPAVAQRYGQEWERLWGESVELKRRY
jgi:phosphatidylserine/phosphatidylglycerophosphate/cardiolipin synthase-like enzyme